MSRLRLRVKVNIKDSHQCMRFITLPPYVR